MPDSLGELRAALAGRYTIERELGRGGNAAVYLAHDVKHDRKVAVKVLQPELALAVRAERFLREIQIAARLNHPHILTLIDSGQAGESLFYVMPYVEGESLRDRLKREKQLPLEDALGIARDVTEALGYAHAEGVVHRDIKPENILLHQGHAVVMDFGIARALVVAGEQTVTESGIAVGTPAYMSPEQASGGAELDARSDLYSLGCVLYEMLAGHAPFTGATAQEIMARHSLDPVPSLRAARPDVPASLESTVARALAKAPAGRYATVAAFQTRLTPGVQAVTVHPGIRWPMFAALAAALLVSGSYAAWRGGWFSTRARGASSLAVLICQTMSTSRETDYLEEGVTDELITALNRVEGLQVPGLSSSRTLKDSPNPVRDAVREFGVGHVVECSVRQTGEQLRISVRLLDDKGSQVWGDVVAGDSRDPFAVLDSVARAVVAVVPGAMAAGTPRALVRKQTASSEAYELYQRGRYQWRRRTAEARRLAIELFESAIKKDSGFALAWSGLADAYLASLDVGSLPVSAGIASAEAAALRAVRHGDSLAETHVSLARVYHQPGGRQDFPAAEMQYRRAFALNPLYPLAHSWYALLLARDWGRRFDEAIREARLAVALDQGSATANNALALVLNRAGQSAEAVDAARRAIAIEPGWGTPYGNLGTALYRLGRYAEAIEAQEAGLRLEPTNPGRHIQLGNVLADSGLHARAVREYEIAIGLGGSFGGGTPLNYGRLGRAYALLGDTAKAYNILRQLEATPRSGDVWAGLAMIYTGLGKTEPAVAALVQALSNEVSINPNAPVWAPIRGDPRIQAILRRRASRP